MYNANLFNSTQAIKTTFGSTGMVIPSGPSKVVPGISEGFANLATTIFQNTSEGPAREEALGLLYKSYLASVGTVVTQWKHGNA